MICFFDPSHGQATVNAMWQPQWGVPRAVEVCQFCAQRIQTTQPPFYQPMQQGYPQPGYAPQPGYPAPGYPSQPGYAPGYAPQPGYAPPPPRPGHSTGAVVGAGAAGLVGGMLIGDMLAEDDNRDEERAYERGYENAEYRDDQNFADYGDGGYDGNNDDGFF